jgi:hypothetical protein
MRNPKQLFAVSTISRADIAKILTDHDAVEEDSDRLTNEFCRGFANALYNLEADYGNMDDIPEDTFFGFVLAQAKKLPPV